MINKAAVTCETCDTHRGSCLRWVNGNHDDDDDDSSMIMMMMTMMTGETCEIQLDGLCLFIMMMIVICGRCHKQLLCLLIGVITGLILMRRGGPR